MAEPCQYLEWDTNFFGFPIGRVNGTSLDPNGLKEIDEWSRRHKVRCLYFLAQSNDPQTTSSAEQGGFHLADMRVTFEHPLRALPSEMPEGLRPAQPNDLPILEEWARAGFTDSRFFYDPHFPPERTAELYAVWIRRDFQSQSGVVLVSATQEDPLLGYISVTHDAAAESAQIGLLGVGPEARGKGVGQALVNGALAWAAGRGAQQVIVVTQGRNITAQRLYQRCGFLTRSIELWYHKWYSVQASEA